MKKLEMKDLTEAEKAEITLLLQKAQANADHTLTNGERNKIREEGRLKIAEDRAKAAKAASALAREKAKERAKNQVLPETFNWADSVSNKYRSKRYFASHVRMLVLSPGHEPAYCPFPYRKFIDNLLV